MCQNFKYGQYNFFKATYLNDDYALGLENQIKVCIYICCDNLVSK